MTRIVLSSLAFAAILAMAAAGPARSQTCAFGTTCGVIVWENGTDQNRPKKGLRASGEGSKGASKRKGEIPVESFSWGQNTSKTLKKRRPAKR
jgi:hypothetical protein